MKANRKTDRQVKAELADLRRQLAAANRRIAELEVMERAQKTAEKEIHSSVNLLDSIIAQSPHSMWISDESSTLIRLNQACRDLLSLSDEDVVGKYNMLRDNIVAEQGHMPLVKRAFEQGQTVNFTIEYDSSKLDHLELKRPVSKILDVTITPVKNENGRVTNAVIMHKDVTERRHLEKQVQRQERLAAVGQLAGGIAHDFNNFLMTIVFYAHLLLRDKDAPPDTVSIAETIVGEANRAANLVRQVLDFSRRSVMDTQPVDLASFVEEVMDILRKTLPENIRVLTEVGNDEYTVEIDPTRIQQAIMNLALNARDAMPNGGQLRIGLSRVTVGPEGMELAGISDLELAAGDWVRLSVVDTGAGMAEHVRTHLFEPFFTTKGPKGNGLGLAQVYGIVKQHWGEVNVQTKLGRGTTFQIYLPAHTKSYQVIESEGMSGIPEGRGETILFIEDEDKVRDAGQRLLQSLGYRVLTVSNGKEGIEVFRRAGKVDLVLTDMIMPEMGGREVIERLKQIAPGIKALIITGYTMQEDIQALKEAGFVDIVYKPLDVGLLGRTIRRILAAENE